MKKQRKKQTKQRSSGFDKRTVIVLAAAAVLFAAALFCIYGRDGFIGDTNVFYDFGDEQVDFEKATVIKVLSEDLKTDKAADDAYVGTQKLSVVVKSGRYKGEKMTVPNYPGALSGARVSEGDSVTLTIKTLENGDHSGTVYEFNRIPILAAFLLLFFAAVVVVGRLTGLKSLAGLILTVICLFAILIPLLLKGAPTILTTFIICAYIALVSFTILGGVHRKTISAFLGTVAGTFFAMIAGLAVQSAAKIDGLRLGDIEALYQLRLYGGSVGLKGLLVAGIIISALGAVMDVAMSISSSLEELHEANPYYSGKDLFKSGMNIGRDMAGTMTNTLILAFLGSEFTLIIYLYASGISFYHLFSTAFVAVETISALSSSLGLILAIPLTAFISSTLIAGERSENRRTK